MTCHNKYESKMVDKKFKQKHTGMSDGTGGGNGATGYRSPRHPYKSKGDRMKPFSNSCTCCSRSAKAKFIVRLQNKKEIKKMIRYD